MKKPFIPFLIFTTLFLLFFPLTASADTGPKPSVTVAFPEMGEELCYGTLLSRNPSTGPQSVWDGDPDHIWRNDLPEEIWKAFVEYEDSDGYYFLQTAWQLNKTKTLSWSYYPPSNFKVLLYYPDTQTFRVGPVCERYAFDSYFTATADGADMLKIEKSYDYSKELLSLAARIVITILIEMLVALLFGFREKKPFLFLICVNTITQVLLNFWLNIVNYTSGQAAFVWLYLLLELGVVILEAILYCVWMKKLCTRPKKNGFYLVYSLSANAASFGAGLLIAHLLPGIF